MANMWRQFRMGLLDDLGFAMLKNKLVWAVLLICAFIAAVPILWTACDRSIASWMHVGKLSENWSTYGTWLQGSLTPLLFGFAIWSFAQQQKATQRQIETQLEANANQLKSNAALIAANEMAERSEFIDRMDRFTLMLNTLAFYTQVRGPMPLQSIPASAATGLQTFIDFVANHSNQTSGAITALRTESFYPVLYSEVKRFVDNAERFKVVGLLDILVISAYKFLQDNPPIK
jgi:hypothetical protein